MNQPKRNETTGRKKQDPIIGLMQGRGKLNYLTIPGRSGGDGRSANPAESANMRRTKKLSAAQPLWTCGVLFFFFSLSFPQLLPQTSTSALHPLAREIGRVSEQKATDQQDVPPPSESDWPVSLAPIPPARALWLAR